MRPLSSRGSRGCCGRAGCGKRARQAGPVLWAAAGHAGSGAFGRQGRGLRPAQETLGRLARRGVGRAQFSELSRGGVALNCGLAARDPSSSAFASGFEARNQVVSQASHKTKRPPSRRPTTPSAPCAFQRRRAMGEVLGPGPAPPASARGPPERRVAPAAPACGDLHHGRPPLLAGWQPDEGAQD